MNVFKLFECKKSAKNKKFKFNLFKIKTQN